MCGVGALAIATILDRKKSNMRTRREWCRWAGAVALMLMVTAATALERPMAVVLDLLGPVELRVGETLSRLPLLDTLAPGVVLGRDSSVVAGYATEVWDLRGAL